MGQNSRRTGSAIARRESAERQDMAVSGSSEDVSSALMVRADGDEFRGNDALFQALLNGANVPCAAQMSGISERTVFRRMADPAFKQSLENARELVRDSILSRLIDAAGDAVDTLWHLQENEDPRIRMAASKSLLDALIKMQNASPKTSTSVRYSVEQTKDG